MESAKGPCQGCRRKLTMVEMHRLDVAGYQASDKTPLTLVVDNVRSRNNVGSLFRTADGFRLERVLLCGITPCPPCVEIHKTALGAEFAVPWEHKESAAAAVRELLAAGYEVLALEQTVGSVSLGALRVEPGRRYALVVGNEVEGVSQDVVDACSQSVEIPQAGTKHSLNVAVSAGIALWHIAARLRKWMDV